MFIINSWWLLMSLDILSFYSAVHNVISISMKNRLYSNVIHMINPHMAPLDVEICWLTNSKLFVASQGHRPFVKVTLECQFNFICTQCIVKYFFSQRSVTLESADFRNYTLNDRSSLSIFKTITISPPFLKHDEYSIEVWWLTEKVTDLIVKSPLVPKRARRRQNYHS